MYFWPIDEKRIEKAFFYIKNIQKFYGALIINIWLLQLLFSLQSFRKNTFTSQRRIWDFGRTYCALGILMENVHHKNRIYTSQWSIIKSITGPMQFDLVTR